MVGLQLLGDIAIALAVAFVGGLIAARLKQPVIAGYLLAGMAIGPFTPGWVGDIERITALAEIGIIFLMFGVGVQFSLRDLWQARRLAVFGGAPQVILSILLGLAIAPLYRWDFATALFVGCITAVTSTTVLSRVLLERGELGAAHGRAAMSWSVVQDIATIVMIVLLPTLAMSEYQNPWGELGISFALAATFLGLMGLLGTKLYPWLLALVARSNSRELFILAVAGLGLVTAYMAVELFGLSPALGAFIAGLVVSESDLSHQVMADVLPLRDAFAVLFFVSVGMLVDPAFIAVEWRKVLVIVALIIPAKFLISSLLGFLLRYPAHTVLPLAAGMAQIGEFSFLLASLGLTLGLLDPEINSLTLAGALVSIVLSPHIVTGAHALERGIRRFSWLGFLNRPGMPSASVETEKLKNHVIIAGHGRVGQYTATVLQQLELPYVVIEIDPVVISHLRERNAPYIYGDSGNPEILKQAGIERAYNLVVAMHDPTTAILTVSNALRLNPKLNVVARANTSGMIAELHRLGVHEVVQPEFEGGLEMMRHTLLSLGLPANEVQRYTDDVRASLYEPLFHGRDKYRLLRRLSSAVGSLAVRWYRAPPGSSLAGRTIEGMNVRGETGALVIALLRDQELIPNPSPSTTMRAHDLIAVLGSLGQQRRFQERFGVHEAEETVVAEVRQPPAETRTLDNASANLGRDSHDFFEGGSDERRRTDSDGHD